MIGCFPDPYPDEILYSICARYKERMMYMSEPDISKSLFGVRYGAFYLDRPLRLQYLISLLPSSNYSIESLVGKNTLVPFFQAFFDRSYLGSYKEDVEKNDSKTRSKIRYTQKVSIPTFLQFCPICLKQDEKQFGEAYWHRLHQIAGIEVCPVHHVFLQKSNVYIQLKYGAESLKTLAEAVHTKAVIKAIDNGFIYPMEPSGAKSEDLLKIAEDASWLLEQDLLSDSECLRNCYVTILRDKGWMVDNEIDKKAFSREFLERFSNFKSLYNLLFYEKNFHKCIYQEEEKEMIRNKYFYDFLESFLLNPNDYHPSCHLLMIHFLGLTAEKFFSLLQRTSEKKIRLFRELIFRNLSTKGTSVYR
jgi:hypothetical protein